MSCWIFQANPDRFDIDGYLAARPPEIFWTVNQRATQLALGDQIFIWRAVGSRDSAESGVIAECEVISAVEALAEDAAARPFWKVDIEQALAARPRVKLRLVRIAEKSNVIKRAWAKHDPVLGGMAIFEVPVQTNFLLTAAQAERLNALWENMGRDWTYPQLVAALWIYDQTHPGRVKPELGEKVAIRIGRTIGSLDSKVMNFRAIDPGDERAGLPAVSMMDRSVWKQFFDGKTGKLRSSALHDEYRRLWQKESEEEWAFLPSKDELLGYWRAHEPSSEQRVLLGAHYWAEEHTIHPGELAKRVGLSGPNEANLRYGSFAGATATGIGIAYPPGADRISLFAAIVGPDGDKRWRLHERVVEAIEILAWHLDFVPAAEDGSFVDVLLQREGQTMRRLVNARMRSATARELCLQAHKAVCVVCELDFGQKFGPEFSGLIDVHHLDPLALAEGSRLTDPVRDCLPLCPNCHRMAHYGLPPSRCRSIDELKELLGPHSTRQSYG